MSRMFLDIETTSLKPEDGKIICIGLAVDDEAPRIIPCLSVSLSKLGGGNAKDEEKMSLAGFWDEWEETESFVGYNIIDFDIPFLIRRSQILGIPYCAVNLAKYRKHPIYDLMWEWAFWNMKRKVKMEVVAQKLGLKPNHSKFGGAMVGELFRRGRYKEIYEKCKEDVRLNREVFKILENAR